MLVLATSVSARPSLYAFRERDRAVVLPSTGDLEPAVSDVYGESPTVPEIDVLPERTIPVAQGRWPSPPATRRVLACS
jgi:hypothetical protein